MPAITFADFGFGLDLRKGASASDANRLRELTNAYVTTGRAIRKRPGFPRYLQLVPNTVGLTSYNDRLQVFSRINRSPQSDRPELYNVNYLSVPSQLAPLFPLEPNDPPTTFNGDELAAIHFSSAFQGFLYVSAEYQSRRVRHHYLDGSVETTVLDTACPHTREVAIAANHIFAVSAATAQSSAHGHNVRFSDIPNPNAPSGTLTGARQWTPVSSPTVSNGAGFLPTGNSRTGNPRCTGLGVFQRYLAVFFEDGVQLWTVDADPAQMALFNNVDAAGSTRHGSIKQSFGDLLYLSNSGYKSIALAVAGEADIESDLGSPIHDLVRPLLGRKALSAFHRSASQHWSILGDQAFVYTFSRGSKVSAWSHYRLPFTVDAVAEQDQTLYLRSGDTVYKVDENVHDDDGVPFEAAIQFPFLDFKAPGILKMLTGLDAVLQGEAEVSIRFDQNDETRATAPVRMRSDTRPGNLRGVELSATAVAPRLTNLTRDPFQLDALTFFYQLLGVR